jgi:hypothetical protein
MSNLLVLPALLLTLSGAAVCGTFEEYALEEEDRDARTFFTSGGTYYLTLNTTYVIVAGVILTALTLGALAVWTFISYLTRPSNSYHTSYPSTSYGYDSYYDGYHYKRRRRIHRSDDYGIRKGSLPKGPFLTSTLRGKL